MSGNDLERAVVILREIFDARNKGLRSCFYGGDWNAIC